MTPETVVETAEAWLGFTDSGDGRTPFGKATKYDGNTYGGLFVDFVFKTAGVVIPSCTYAPSGLGEFIRGRRVVSRPCPGDVVFFTFAADGSMSVPHVGLVTDVSHWKRTDGGLVGTIEAGVGSGLPRSNPGVTGVFRRVRSFQEVLAFARPKFRPQGEVGKARRAKVVSLGSVKPGRRNSSIGLVQQALGLVCDLRFATSDMFDGPTQAAFARWQRIIGYVGSDANGVPDRLSLELLGARSGVFCTDMSDL